MLDHKLVASHPEVVRASLVRRHAGTEMVQSLDHLVAVIARRRELQQETDELRATRNTMSQADRPADEGRQARRGGAPAAGGSPAR